MLSRSFDLKKFTELTKDKLEKVIKGSMSDLCEAVIMDTPVDTGRLRGNWYPAINEYSLKEDWKHFDKIGTDTVQKANNMIEKVEIGDKFTMSNNLVYAPIIEYTGHSKIKAPRGMVRINLVKFNSIVKKRVRELK